MHQNKRFNVVIAVENAYFRFGMQSLLASVLPQMNIETTIATDNVKTADLIIVELGHGEIYSCYPELRERNQAQLIGFVGNNIESRHNLPICFQNIVLIKRRASLQAIATALREGISQSAKKASFFANCLDCRCPQLSEQQKRVIACLYHGLSAEQSAARLNVNLKTVYAHKYAVMHQFGLKGDFQMITFLNRLITRQHEQIYFRKNGLLNSP